MIRCKQVATLLTTEQLYRESFWKRLEVKFHLVMCEYCGRFARQLEQFQRAARRMAADADADSSSDEEHNLEARLLRKLSEKN